MIRRFLLIALAVITGADHAIAQSNTPAGGPPAAVLFVPAVWTYGNHQAAAILQSTGRASMLIAVRNEHPSASLVDRALRTLMMASQVIGSAHASHPPRKDGLTVLGIDDSPTPIVYAKLPAAVRQAVADLAQQSPKKIPGFGNVKYVPIFLVAVGSASVSH